MDKTVDHIFVFEGNGVIKDFPGNYSDYREWKTLTEKENLKKTTNQVSNSNDTRKQRDNSNKLTFKEKKEFEALEKDLELLNKEKAEIETLFQSGASTDELIKLSSRYEQIKEELDEKELRWLELSEKES
jgi:ATP-binding cassette subfamily F protein uup